MSQKRVCTKASSAFNSVGHGSKIPASYTAVKMKLLSYKLFQELFDELSVQLMDEDTNEPIDARETIISAMTRAESMTAPAF